MYNYLGGNMREPYFYKLVKPVLYIDQESGEVVGKCKLMPYKPYIALELK